MELMAGGCLTDLVQLDSIKLPENVIAYIMRESLSGLAYLHQRHIIHRDIKSDNVLVGENGEIKIADFGYAAQLIKSAKSRKTVCGVIIIIIYNINIFIVCQIKLDTILDGS